MNTAKQKERELIVKLSKEKRTTREIASILGISKSKSAFWVKRFRETKSLQDKSRNGRPTPLTKEELVSIRNQIKSRILEPKKEGIKAGISSKEVLELIEHKTKRRYTLRHTQRLLHKIGLSLTTPRVSHIRKDEAAQNKFREEFKKNSSRNIWVIQ